VVRMSYSYERDAEDDKILMTINVNCPEDYDGTVFQIGYSDMSINEANASIDYSTERHTIDELPGFNTNGHDYLYFSYT